MLDTEYILLGTSLLFLLSILASKASGRLGIPILLLCLILGMLAGSDGIGGIYFDDPSIAQFIGIIALIFILFSGGLETDWQSTRTVLLEGLLLSTLGVLMTTALVGWFAYTIVHFSLLEGLLLGSIVASTDAAAVFSILRARSLRLKSRVKSLVEFESASNDPMAVFLTLGVIRLLTLPDISVSSLVRMFAIHIIFGSLAGCVMGSVIPWLINRVNLDHEGLYAVLIIALVLLTYSLTSWIGGNGFLAVYLTGLVMSNKEFFNKRELIRFQDSVTWFMQIIMFLALGLLVFPSKLLQVAEFDIAEAVFLMLVARPVSVFALTSFSQLQFKEKLMIAWMGLRGAVPIILATFPLVAGINKAEAIFNSVFFIVLTSMLFQGTSIPWVAKYLNLER